MNLFSLFLAILGIGLTIFSVRREYKHMMFVRSVAKSNREALGEFDPSRLKDPQFNVEAYEIGGFWRSLEERARVSAVVSGKGGVGKSVIALALAQAYGENEKVLLVDFDLHNRGLTSKLGDRVRKLDGNLWSLLTTFNDLVVPEIRARLTNAAGEVDLAKMTRLDLISFRDIFSYTNQDKNLRKIAKVHLFSDKSADSVCVAQNVFFLSSRGIADAFLASKISRLDIPEVAIFIKCLATLARRVLNVDRVILDCHGAHDLFMAGAIVASEDLVVVSKAEASAFDGTFELVHLSKKLVLTQKCAPEREVLVMNEIRPVDNDVCDKLVEVMNYDKKNVVKIAYDESVIAAQRDVKFPVFHRVPDFWAAIRKVAWSSAGSAGSVGAKAAAAESPVRLSEGAETAVPAPTPLATNDKIPAGAVPSQQSSSDVPHEPT